MIPEDVIIKAVAREFGIQPDHLSIINDANFTNMPIHYSLYYHKTGFAINLSLFIDESKTAVRKNALDVAKDLSAAWIQDILIPVPTELPGLENANPYLLLVKPSGETFLVIETDSDDGVTFDESPGMMKKIE